MKMWRIRKLRRFFLLFVSVLLQTVGHACGHDYWAPAVSELGNQVCSPSSFSAMGTFGTHQDMTMLLYSLSRHHPGATVYLFCDSELTRFIQRLPGLNLNLQIKNVLDKYGNRGRREMEHEGDWASFQMEKSNVMDHALARESDTLFLDSDILVLGPIQVPCGQGFQLGLCPHLISQESADKYGYFNGGIVWTSDKLMPELWRLHTPQSRYFDQTSLEDIRRVFKTFMFDLDMNFSWWRPNYVADYLNGTKVDASIQIEDGILTVDNKRILSVHTHFFSTDPLYTKFSSFLLGLLNTSTTKYGDVLRVVDFVNHKFDTKYSPVAPREHSLPQPPTSSYQAFMQVVPYWLIVRLLGAFVILHEFSAGDLLTKVRLPAAKYWRAPEYSRYKGREHEY